MQLDLFPQDNKPLARAPHSDDLPIEHVETAIEILVRLIVQTASQPPGPVEDPDER